MKKMHDSKVDEQFKILASAIELITEKGLLKTTMRSIARAADIPEKDLYNHFTTKEAVVRFFYLNRIESSLKQRNDTPGIEEYSFHEQIQLFMEIYISLLTADREFVQATFKETFIRIPKRKFMQPIKKVFMDSIDDCIETFLSSGKIPEQPLLELTSWALWNLHLDIVLFWLQDDSERFVDTTLLIDKSIDFLGSFIEAGMINKTDQLMRFIISTGMKHCCLSHAPLAGKFRSRKTTDC